jgi:hypothetical protein
MCAKPLKRKVNCFTKMLVYRTLRCPTNQPTNQGYFGYFLSSSLGKNALIGKGFVEIHKEDLWFISSCLQIIHELGCSRFIPK